MAGATRAVAGETSKVMVHRALAFSPEEAASSSGAAATGGASDEEEQTQKQKESTRSSGVFPSFLGWRASVRAGMRGGLAAWRIRFEFVLQDSVRLTSA